MAELERDDGVRIHWDQRGQGPLVVPAPMYNMLPSRFEGLLADLAADHTVVSYHLRGNGPSTPGGPYDVETDARDLAALIEAAGPPAVLVGLGDGAHRAIRTAALRPELVSAVVVSGSLVLGRAGDDDASGWANSRSVLQAFSTMSEIDYRAAVRTQLQSGNPEMSEDEIREAVDEVVTYAPVDSALPRLRSWMRDNVTEPAVAVGGRLWFLYYVGNPWFPATLVDRLRERLPQAHFEAVEDGAITRPELTAAVVRRLTEAQAA